MSIIRGTLSMMLAPKFTAPRGRLVFLYAELWTLSAALPEGSRLFDQEASHSIAFAVLQAILAPPGTVNLAEFCKKQLKNIRARVVGLLELLLNVQVSNTLNLPEGKTAQRSFGNSRLLL